MRKKKKEEDPTCPTMPIQAAGWKYFGLGRNASYEAAKAWRNSHSKDRRQAPRIGRCLGQDGGEGCLIAL